MSLFVILTLITFIDAYRTRIIALILKLLPKDGQIFSISKEILDLEKDLNTISMVNEFAKHVKLQRRIIKLREEKKELAKKNAFRVMKIRYSLMTALYIVILGCLITIIWSNRSEPVVQVPPHWLWPVSSFFDWSNYIPGCITVPCWVAISSSASKIIAKHI